MNGDTTKIIDTDRGVEIIVTAPTMTEAADRCLAALHYDKEETMEEDTKKPETVAYPERYGDGWFRWLKRTCPHCEEPLEPICRRCKRLLPFKTNTVWSKLDSWSLRLACVLLVTGILGTLGVANAWLWSAFAEILAEAGWLK